MSSTREQSIIEILSIALVGLRAAVRVYDADDLYLSNVEAALRDLGLDPDEMARRAGEVPSAVAHLDARLTLEVVTELRADLSTAFKYAVVRTRRMVRKGHDGTEEMQFCYGAHRITLRLAGEEGT
jgi:hypothetical protein